jgi:hypothetical protein
MISEKVIVLMATVHEHLRMENLLEKEGIQFDTLVKPRQLGTDCGMALGIQFKDVKRVEQIAGSRKAQIYGIYFNENNVWKNVKL